MPKDVEFTTAFDKLIAETAETARYISDKLLTFLRTMNCVSFNISAEILLLLGLGCKSYSATFTGMLLIKNIGLRSGFCGALGIFPFLCEVKTIRIVRKTRREARRKRALV